MGEIPKPIVNMMIIGVQKCGTTALAEYLSQHSDICMAWGKEVHLFDRMETQGFKKERLDRFYSGYFTHYNGEKYCGEATPSYLYQPNVIKQLKDYNSKLKLIIVLCDPVERAISHYSMEYSRCREKLSINRAFLFERWRMLKARWLQKPKYYQLVYSYLDRGRYTRQINQLYQYFERNQVFVINNNMLLNQHEETLKAIYQFLAIEVPNKIPKSKKIFVTEDKYYPSKIIYQWMRWQFRKDTEGKGI